MSRWTAEYLPGEGELLHTMGHLLADLAEFPNMDPSESLASRRRLYVSLSWVASLLACTAGRAAALVDQPKPRRRSAASAEVAVPEENEKGGEA